MNTRTRSYLLTLAAPGEPVMHRTVGEAQVLQALDDLHRGDVPAGASLSVTVLAA
jgi:hypothetical protein